MEFSSETIKSSEQYMKDIDNEIEELRKSKKTRVPIEEYIQALELLKACTNVIIQNETKWLLTIAGGQEIIN